MDRAEAAGFGVALGGHVALLAVRVWAGTY